MTAGVNESVVRWYECERKRRFVTWDEAEKAGLRSWQETTQESINPPLPYLCQHCSAYHVGRYGGRAGGEGMKRRSYKALRLWRRHHE